MKVSKKGSFLLLKGHNGLKPPQLKKDKLTVSQTAADFLTRVAGSWTFIISLLVMIAIWMSLNLWALFVLHWDPYPFILLNFVLSCLAALQGPIILMSQNRENERDRQRAKYDYQINRKAEREIQNMQKDLDSIKRLLQRRL